MSYNAHGCRSALSGRVHYLYRAYIGEQLAYVGVTVNPAGRFANHKTNKHWWAHVTRTHLQEFRDREAAFAAEALAIAVENPTHNNARPRGRR